MKVFSGIISLAFLTLMLAGCGGGGDSSGGGSSSTSSSSSSTSSSSSSSSTSSGSPDTVPPTATIRFPIKDAQISEGTITLRGTATDNDGIQAVYVNGVAATLSAAQASTAAAAGLRRIAAETGETSVEWEITLQVPFGDNAFEVVAEDSAGNVDTEPETVTVRHTSFPPSALLDVAHDRLVGIETYTNGLALDLVTNTLSEIPGVSTGELLAVNAAGTQIYAIANVGNDVTLRSQDLSTGVESIENSFTFTFDTGVWESALLWDYVYLESANVVYLLYQMVPVSSGDPWESGIYSWDIGTNVWTQIPLSVTTGSVPIIDRIKLAGTKLAGLVSSLGGNTTGSVVSIDPATGVVSPVAENLALARAFAVAAAGDYAYLAGYDAVVRVALADGAVTDISLDADQELFNFAQFNHVILDEARNQLLVADIGMREMIKVDLLTGERSLLYPNGIGEGRKLITPRELAVTADNKTAYAADDGDNAPESIFKIDIETGDRTRLGDIKDEVDGIATGIALDETGNRLFYSFDNSIYMMDLATQTATIISDGTGVALNGVSALHYDANTAELLALDGAQDLLVSINPETKDRTQLALLTDGPTPPIGYPVDLAVSEDGGTYYVLGRDQGALYSVNAATGAREILLDECFSPSDQDKLSSGSVLQNMDFDAATGKFLIAAENSILEYDLAEGNCRVASQKMNAFDVLYLEDGTILASNWNRLMQFDPVNGDFVTLSK